MHAEHGRGLAKEVDQRSHQRVLRLRFAVDRHGMYGDADIGTVAPVNRPRRLRPDDPVEVGFTHHGERGTAHPSSLVCRVRVVGETTLKPPLESQG